MQRLIFQVQPGQSPESPPIETVLTGRDAVRKAALDMCADLAKDIVAGQTENSEWRLVVRDETAEPVFRISGLAESLAP